MTIPRVRNYGWARGEAISPSEMEQLDINHTRAIDGCNGGAYAPSAQLIVGEAGFSTDPLGEVDIEGHFALGPLGRLQWRVDTTTIADAAFVHLDSRHDVYYASLSMTTPNIFVTLIINSPGHKTPSTGERLRVVLPYPNATTALAIWSQGGGAPLITLGPIVWPPCAWADFIYTGTAWRLSANGTS